MKSIIFNIIFGFLLVCFVLVAFIFWMKDPYNLSAPKDQELIAIFNDHHEAFERLRQMATEDSKSNHIYIKNSEIVGIKDTLRRQEYRKLLSSINSDIRVVADEGNITFFFSGGGLSAISGGWGKGIASLPLIEKYDTILPSLDHANMLPNGDYMRPIDGQWFIYYQKYED
jgi:hypothetical protein